MVEGIGHEGTFVIIGGFVVVEGNVFLLVLVDNLGSEFQFVAKFAFSQW